LLGDRDLLGPQCSQHRIAVHGRRRRDGSLASGRASLALSGAPGAWPAGAGAAAGTTAATTRAIATWAAASGAAASARSAAAGATARAVAAMAASGRPALFPVVTIFVTSTAALPRARGEDHRHVGSSLGRAEDLDAPGPL